MIIGKHFTFDSSHILEGEQYGKCSNLHGHTYHLIVKVEGKVNEDGWVCNFSEVKKIVNETVVDKLDHKHLNAIINLPTAENILEWIYLGIVPEILTINGVELHSLVLYETPTSFAELIC